MRKPDRIDGIIDAGADVKDGFFAVVIRRLDGTCTRGKDYSTLRIAVSQASRIVNTAAEEACLNGYVVSRRDCALTLWLSTNTFLRKRYGLKASDPKRLTEAELKALLGMAPWDYPKDVHYERFALASITTEDDANNFLAELDRESPRGTCTKAESARHSIAYKHHPVIEHVDWVRNSIARARRVCCSCHDTGSFARRDKR